MDPPKRLCVYVYLRAKKEMGSVHGFIYPTRQDAIGFFKRQFPSLSCVEDSLLTFSANGHRIPDEPGYWEAITVSIPTGTTIEIRSADADVKTEKTGLEDVVPPEPCADDSIDVRMVFKSIAGQVLLDYTHRTKPITKLSRSFQAFADEMKRARSDFAFFQNGRLVEGEQTCAEATVDFSKPINVVNKPGVSNRNDPARAADGVRTQPMPRDPSVGAAAAKGERAPAVNRPPRQSAPTDDSTADQRPGSNSPARQHLPAASSTSADALIHPAAGADVVQEDRASGPSAAAQAEPSVPDADVAGKKRASGDVNAVDGDVGGSSPERGERPSKKKAKIVKDKVAKPVAIQENPTSSARRTKAGTATGRDTSKVDFPLEDAREQMRAMVWTSMGLSPPPKRVTFRVYKVGEWKEDEEGEDRDIGTELRTRDRTAYIDDPLGPILQRICTKVCDPGVRDFQCRFGGAVISLDATPYSLGLSTGDAIYGMDKVSASMATINILPPQEMDILCKLTIPDQAKFTKLWPRGLAQPSVEELGNVFEWDLRVAYNGMSVELDRQGGAVQPRNKISHLSMYWYSDDIYAKKDETAHYSLFNTGSAVILPGIHEMEDYLDGALEALGLDKNRRDQFLHGWDASLPLEDWLDSAIIFRFLPQADPDLASTVELTPPAEVVTRIFLIFELMLKKDASKKKWQSAVARGQKRDFEAWRRIVGVPSRAKQNDTTKLRVVECGAMEVHVSM